MIASSMYEEAIAIAFPIRRINVRSAGTSEAMLASETTPSLNWLITVLIA